ncbi:hypothetical protein, partial [Enorma timonensis]|uniref:hypothetical protein n=1 Tax=Enorma timonensis TaxID=1232436 RepID=UPI001E28E3D7
MRPRGAWASACLFAASAFLRSSSTVSCWAIWSSSDRKREPESDAGTARRFCSSSSAFLRSRSWRAASASAARAASSAARADAARRRS